MVIIEYILGSLFRVIFILLLLVFHPIQVIAYNLLGESAQQKATHLLNGSILLAFRIAGNRLSFNNSFELPHDKPSIIIANHQSLWDIVGIYWYLRKTNPVFVSKIELAKGIPSISYNLRKSGAALINRKNRKQAIVEISKLGKKLEKEGRAGVIFAEGTRSKDGKVKQFNIGGISMLLNKSPDAIIIPLAISGTSRMEASKRYRINAFKKVNWTVLEPFSATGLSAEDIANRCETDIRKVVE